MSALAPALTAPVLRLERKLARDLRAMTDAALAPVRNLVADLDSGDPLTSAKAGRLLLAVERLEKRPPLAKVAIRRVSGGLAEIAGHGLAQSRQEVRQAVGFAKSPGVLAADVDYYHTAAAAMVDRLQADTYAAVRQRVERGLQRGETDAEIGQRILGLGTSLTPAHCDTWAITETTRFYTLGRVRGIEEAGDYVWGYRYVVIVDNATTDICRQFIGKRVAKAAMTRFPPFHYRCRTTVTAVMSQEVTGEDPQPRGTQLPVRLVPEPQEGFGGDPREYLPERKAKPSLRRRAGQVAAPPVPATHGEPAAPVGDDWRHRLRKVEERDVPTLDAQLRDMPPRDAATLRMEYANHHAWKAVPPEVQRVERPGPLGHVGAAGDGAWGRHDQFDLGNWTPRPLEHLRSIGFEGTDARLGKVADALYAFTGGKWKKPGVQAAMNDYVRRSTPYKGPILRSLDLPEHADGSPDTAKYRGVDRMEVGGTITMEQASSFSSGRPHGGNLFLVVLQNRTGASVRGYSSHMAEDEVVVPKGARYRILSVQDTTIDLPEHIAEGYGRPMRKAKVVYLEEVTG